MDKEAFYSRGSWSRLFRTSAYNLVGARARSRLNLEFTNDTNLIHQACYQRKNANRKSFTKRYFGTKTFKKKASTLKFTVNTELAAIFQLVSAVSSTIYHELAQLVSVLP